MYTQETPPTKMIYLKSAYQGGSLPPAGSRGGTIAVCKDCKRYAWARLDKIAINIRTITKKGKSIIEADYLPTSGRWILCTACYPPPLLRAFFAEHDSITKAALERNAA